MKYMMQQLREEEVEAIRASVMFDANWYITRYPDVARLNMDPVEHYLWIGARLGRDPSPRFKSTMYLEKNPDVAEANMNPLVHYILYGQKEGRIVSDSRDSLSESDLLEKCTLPYYGKQFYDLVEKAKSRTKNPGTSKEYDTIKSAFDFHYYLAKYSDLARAKKLDFVQHYIEWGWREGRNPSPHFSTKHYLARYPDVDINPFYHWLTIGRPEGRIAQPYTNFEEMCDLLNLTPKDVEDTLIARRNDLRSRLEHGVLGEMVAKATKLEPLIAHAWREAFDIKLPPFHSDSIVLEVVAIHRLHQAANFSRAKAAVVIPHCRLSGSTRIAGYLASALAETYSADELVIIRTDLDVMQFPKWFPDGCRHIDFVNATKKLNSRQKQKILTEFLRSLCLDCIFNVNSSLLWDVYMSYGKALSSSMSLYSYFFCNDKTIYGFWDGYPIKYFYRHFDTLAGVITDSHFLADELRQRYLVPPAQIEKIVVLETPVVTESPPAQRPAIDSERRPQVFWSGRFDRQKRVDIVRDVAQMMPDVLFRLWGEPVTESNACSFDESDNIRLEGVYSDISELPLEQCDLWLYTSEWDGVPNILIEISALGIPLVGSLTGGTGEILRDGYAYAVADIENVNAYVTAIRSILDNPAVARERALELRSLVVSRRTPENYRQALLTLLAQRGTV